MQVLKEPGKRAQSQSYLWVQRGGPPDNPIVLYDYDPSRSQRVPLRLLEGFNGYLQTDGYEAYARVCAEYDLTAVGCWAHARRKFDEAIKAQGLLNVEKQEDALGAVALAKIQQLYRIEREIKSLDYQERHEIRQRRSVPCSTSSANGSINICRSCRQGRRWAKLCSMLTSSGTSSQPTRKTAA